MSKKPNHINTVLLSRHILVFSVVFVFSIFTSLSAYSQPCACCNDNYNEFDFWLGEWVVTDTSGTIVGENTITELEDGCIISEHWIGKGGTTGRSYNYFNKSDSTWNQLWIDNKGGNLVLKGNFTGEQMVLKSEMKLVKGKHYYNRITWTPYPDGTVVQTWDILSEDNRIENRLFKGIYSKK